MVLVHYEQFLSQSQVDMFQGDRRSQEPESRSRKWYRTWSTAGGTLGRYLLLFALTRFALAQVPEIPYDSMPNLLKLPPDLYLGEVAGVAVNSKGHIFVFTRANTTGPAYGAASAQLLEFSPDGQFLREIGHNLYAWAFAHSVKIDREDNIWVADKGTDNVVKFS